METLSFCASERILEVFVSFESASTIIAEDDRDIDTDDLFLGMSSITVKDGREETIAYASTDSPLVQSGCRHRASKK